MAGQMQQLDREAYIVYTGISAEYGTGFSLVIEMQMQKMYIWYQTVCTSVINM